MLNWGLNMFVSLIFMLSMNAQAQDLPEQPVFTGVGNFSILDEGECAPFPGVIFDADATASILTIGDYYRESCRLSTTQALGLQQAEYKLEIDQLNIRLDLLEQEYESTLIQKDLEIVTLQDALKKNSKRNPWLWGTIGAVVGASLTVAIVETVRD